MYQFEHEKEKALYVYIEKKNYYIIIVLLFNFYILYVVIAFRTILGRVFS